MPIDFRKKQFNHRVRSLIKISRKEIQESGDKKLIMQCVNNLQMAFMDYYAYSETKKFNNKLGAFFEGRKVYGMFLQNLIYLYYHDFDAPHLDSADDDLISLLINKHDFFYFDEKKNIFSLWIDPKSDWTALISLCKAKDLTNLNLFLKNMVDKTQGNPNSQFQAYVRHQVDNRFSALICAVEEGSIEMVQALLDSATIFCGGKRTKAFQDLLLDMTKEKKSALLMATLKGHSDIVRLLLQTGADAFYEDDAGFLNLIDQKNIRGETSLELANTLKHDSIEKMLFKARSKHEPKKTVNPLARLLYADDFEKENIGKSESKESSPPVKSSSLKRKIFSPLVENPNTSAPSPKKFYSEEKFSPATTGFYAHANKRQVRDPAPPLKKHLQVKKAPSIHEPNPKVQIIRI